MRNLSHKLCLLLLCVLFTETMSAKQHKRVIGQKPVTEDSTYIFAFTTDNKGLKLAVSNDCKVWQLINGGNNVLTCDYGRWGSEKKMITPVITNFSDSLWCAVWSVNDYSPCFAVTVSKDWISWRPQDYPRMSTNCCLTPLILDYERGLYNVRYRTKDSLWHQTTSPDLRHFSADKVVPPIVFHNKQNPDITYTSFDIYKEFVIGGKKDNGQLWHLKSSFVDKIKRDYDDEAKNNILYSERLKDDSQTLADIKTDNVDGSRMVKASLTVDGRQSKKTSDKLIGAFFEDISYAADGGLYAEMIQNRDFEYRYSEKEDSRWDNLTGWRPTGKITFETTNPISKNNSQYIIVYDGTLTNSGWDGISLNRGDSYDFSLYARNISRKSMPLNISLISKDKTIASARITVNGNTWNKFTAVMVADDSVNDAELCIEPMKSGGVALDMISLFPQKTFKNRKNGLRADLAQTIADLHPKFMRFPGGCLSHGDGLDNIYRWKESVGELKDRVPARNIWNYHQTRGLGFYEFFQFCEDIGCEPLPVLAAGVPCQNSRLDSCGFGGQQGGIPMKEMPQYVQDILDLIEWANGDPSTNKWAKMRADAGHQAPFNLHYIGIGNEDLISSVFEERYLMICKAIKERYPDIKVCGTVGPFHKGSSDYDEGWKIARENKDIIDMVDEHYYESTGWFLHNKDYYDSYDRNSPKVYLGEYAASTSQKRSNVETALCEAYYLCNIERNGDVVSMTSYAPLLAKEHHTSWNPDMIYFNNDRVTVTPSYETQRLFSTHSGDEYIQSSLNADSLAATRIAASVVRDSHTGNIFLKLVNILPVPLRIDIHIKV